MDRKQAIETLRANYPDACYEQLREAVDAAIEALKAQLYQQGTTKDATSDLISKTETVEHLRRMLESTVPNTDYDEGFIDGIEFGISTVSTMPIIQPQSTTGQLNDGARSTAQSTDLIDRQAVIDAVEKNACNTQRIMDAVNNLPSAQPERKKGRWLPDNNSVYEMRFICSECKESEVVPTIGFTKYKPIWDYCPNCGAKMTISTK